MDTVAEGTLLWEPSTELREGSNLAHYMEWLKEEKDLSFDDYEELWEWSVARIEDFWESIWEYRGVEGSMPYERVLSSREMPGARWFEGSELNYAQHVFKGRNPEGTAVMYQSELRSLGSITWEELRERVGSLAGGLKELGVGSGDRVVAYVPNSPEALIAFLACASIGAVWSSCSPDFGVGSVVDRFAQIEPKVLFAVDGYRYGGEDYDRMRVVGRSRTRAV